MHSYSLIPGVTIDALPSALRINLDGGQASNRTSFIITKATAEVVKLAIHDQRTVTLNGDTIYYGVNVSEPRYVHTLLSNAIFLFLANEPFPEKWKKVDE